MLSRKYLLVLALLVLATAPAWSDVRHDTLQGSLGRLDLDSSATLSASVWSYDYTLTFVSGIANVHIFTVDNPNASPWTNATNLAAFANPAWNPLTPWLEWARGSLAPGQSANFHYESLYAPSQVAVEATAYDGGTFATGFTLGMSPTVPEPGCIASLAGLLGMSGFYFRRGRKK